MFSSDAWRAGPFGHEGPTRTSRPRGGGIHVAVASWRHVTAVTERKKEAAAPPRPPWLRRRNKERGQILGRGAASALSAPRWAADSAAPPPRLHRNCPLTAVSFNCRQIQKAKIPIGFHRAIARSNL